MKKTSYNRKPGDFEIRILKDGRVIVPAPDEKLLDVIEEISPTHKISIKRKGARTHAQHSTR